MAREPRPLQEGHLLQRLVGGLPGSDPRRPTRGHRQEGRRDLPRRALDQHPPTAAFALGAQDALVLQVAPDAPLLPDAFHPPSQPGATEHHSRVKHYQTFEYEGGYLTYAAGLTRQTVPKRFKQHTRKYM